MDFHGVRLLVSPPATLAAVLAIAAGVALGTCSGLLPGLHVNNLALLLAAAAPSLPGPPHLVAATMLAAAVVHSFLDAVPALALGVPDAAMAATALPAHRLVIAGRGREAIRLSALGSGGAVALAIPLAAPVTWTMTRAYPTIRAHLPLVLAVVVLFLLATEPGRRARVGGAICLLASGTLGLLALPRDPVGVLPTGDVLLPLFAGLFGAPVLLDALRGAGVPPQADAAILSTRRSVGVATLAGSLAGGLVGYLPGVSSAVGATIALAATPGGADERRYVVATSGVNTSNAIFALLALVSLGTPRTGVLVAMEEARLPLNVPLLFATILLAACAGAALVVLVGDRYLAVVGRLDNVTLSAAVLCLLVGLSWAFAGTVGLAAFGAATLVGLLPTRLGARRVHCMGVLLVPLAL